MLKIYFNILKTGKVHNKKSQKSALYTNKLRRGFLPLPGTPPPSRTPPDKSANAWWDIDPNDLLWNFVKSGAEKVHV